MLAMRIMSFFYQRGVFKVTNDFTDDISWVLYEIMIDKILSVAEGFQMIICLMLSIKDLIK